MVVDTSLIRLGRIFYFRANPVLSSSFRKFAAQNVLFPFLCIMLLYTTESPAQVQVDSFDVHTLTFEGNETFGKDELRELIFTRESPGFLSRFFYGLFGEALGSKAQIFNRDILFLDIQKLQSFYRERGYFTTTIRDSVVFDTSNARVEIFLFVDEGRPSFIDTLHYRGLEEIPENVLQKIFETPAIHRGQVFVEKNFNDEVDRILIILGNEGYPNAQFNKEESYLTHYLSTNNLSVVIVFTVGRRLHFGPISVTVEDTLRKDITEDIVLRQLDFEEGEIYSREKRILSERNLNRLGVFETTRIDAIPTAEAETTGIVPVEIRVRPRDKHELNPEIVVSDENNAFNLSFGMGYLNRNFLGEARSFNTRLRLRTQSIQEWNFSQLLRGRGFRDTSILGGVELQFHLAQPYLFTNTLSGSWTFSLSAEKQKLYVLPIIRNKIGLVNRFSKFTNGIFDWTLERVSVEFVPEDTTGAQIDFSRRREEERPQFNSILTSTFQYDKTNDIFSPSEGFFHSLTVEESGILPKLLKNLQPNLPFTQFYKFTLLSKWYDDVTTTKFNIFAFKLRVGYQDKYGESKRIDTIRIPLNRRFFSGGSGSVRGWKSRDLGAMPINEVQFGGNFVFEGSYEIRVNHFRGFGKLLFLNLDNFWAVYFVDAGNVWTDIRTFKAKDIALAAGVGIRYETLFGPFRVDFGFRVYDPRETPEKQWFFNKRFFGDVLKNGILHFGLGHAF
jgi:outer membrane protein insertion porin family